jgi:uncharacterized protein YbbC (DUF1343 family)
MPKMFILQLLLFFQVFGKADAPTKPVSTGKNKITPGAERTTEYLYLLKGRKVAVFANQTSMIGKTHLVDSLLKLNIKVIKIFSPEHGFRGTADAGEKVNNGKDAKTGLPVVSLYGHHKKPTKEDLADVDMLLFDVQDVGTRFYTYISSLQYMMEAGLENNKPLLILDRPNPNGWYIDGPVMEPAYKSFVGLQPVPIVYGMTIGEYAMMLAGEKWLDDGANKFLRGSKQDKGKFQIKVITCANYDHTMKYELPVNPSPNLREMQSIYWYPTTCLFEGTILSEGRGTEKPFQIIGHPDFPKHLFSFTPVPNFGAKSSKCYHQICYGWNLSGSKQEVLKKINGKIQLKILLEAYELFPGKDSFFIKENFYQKAGNASLMEQIREGKSEEEIRKSWQPGLKRFKAIRKKYLLYKDFY